MEVEDFIVLFSLSYYLLDDDIFPLKTWLPRPFPGAKLSIMQLTCNYRQSRGRRLMEIHLEFAVLDGESF